MKHLRILPLLGMAGLSLVSAASWLAAPAQAADEDTFLAQILPPSEQTIGQGQTALWTLPHVVTQYQPALPTPLTQAALQAQHEGRYLEAMILLDEASKDARANADTRAEVELLRTSFLLQGSQSQQALEILAPLIAETQHAADARALSAMTHLQQGRMQEALAEAQHARILGSGMLPHLVLSYALQGVGRLAEAHAAMHGFNSRTPPLAVALAREAELDLTLDRIQSARTLMLQAREVEASHPYVVAVGGLVYLIDGHASEAKAAFETALLRDAKDAKALLGLGLADIKLGNFQAGQKQLLMANEAEPGNALILTYLGRSQQQLGKTAAARESWHSAQLADPKDPAPWLYQAQAQLQANQPLQARASLRQAQTRSVNRAVYRGANLLREDEQLLQANLAETQRRLGLDSLAFHTLSATASEKNSANLKNQADMLQGQRFGESARRSLLLQSQFNARPGTLPSALDIYGDGAGQTGAATPQHGVVSGLDAQQASYNDFGELFSPRTTLEADAITGSQNSNGEQIRLGVGSDTLGLSIAQRQYQTDGNGRFEGLDNRSWLGIAQWRPVKSTQVFVSYQTFNSQRGETFYPADPFFGTYAQIMDDSRVTRLGLRHTLAADSSSELRGLWSRQQTDQAINSEYISLPFPFSTSGSSSSAHSEELQYRSSGLTHTTQLGVHAYRGQAAFRQQDGSLTGDDTRKSKQFYAAWQRTLNPYWQLDAELGWGNVDDQDNTGGVNSKNLRRWLPKLGMVYTPDTDTHVRLAAWQGLGVPGVGDATLAPVSLAGILLTRPSDNGKLVQAVALGGDRQLGSAWLLAAEAQQRKVGEPFIELGQQALLVQQIDETKLALHWQPQARPWSVSLAHEYEQIRNDPKDNALDSVDEQRLRTQQLALRWFASTQWTVNLAWSHNRVTGLQKSHDPSFTPVLVAYQESFNQVDANLSWQFNRSRGTLTTGVRNATDTRFQYADLDRLNPRFSAGRLLYAKLQLAW